MSNKEELLAEFEALRKALIECNTSELNSIIAEDYSGFSLNGTIEAKKDIISNFKPGGIKISTYEVSDLEYKVISEIGIVRGEGIIEGSYLEFEFKHKVLFTDIFKLENDTWKYYRSQVTEIPPTNE
jgi:hypothetical protein